MSRAPQGRFLDDRSGSQQSRTIEKAQCGFNVPGRGHIGCDQCQIGLDRTAFELAQGPYEPGTCLLRLSRKVNCQTFRQFGIESRARLTAHQTRQCLRVAATHRVNQNRVDVATVLKVGRVGAAQPLIDKGQQVPLHFTGGMVAKHHRILNELQGPYHREWRNFDSLS